MIPMLVLDTETTGVDVETARIVTMYAGVLDAAGTVVAEVEWLIAPEGFVIPAESTAVHGVTHEHAAQNGIPLEMALTRLGESIQIWAPEGTPIVGQNISYDLTVIDREAARVWPGAHVGMLLAGHDVLDSLVLDKQLVPRRRGGGARRLVPLAAAYGVHLTEEEAHGARADAIAAGRIVQKQLTRAAVRGRSLPELHALQIGWKREQAASLQSWFRSNGKPNEVVNGDWPVIPRPSLSAVA